MVLEENKRTEAFENAQEYRACYVVCLYLVTDTKIPL